jgi:hypothetical protein
MPRQLPMSGLDRSVGTNRHERSIPCGRRRADPRVLRLAAVITVPSGALPLGVLAAKHMGESAGASGHA